jgi:hypothetical protein
MWRAAEPMIAIDRGSNGSVLSRSRPASLFIAQPTG